MKILLDWTLDLIGDLTSFLGPIHITLGKYENGFF